MVTRTLLTAEDLARLPDDGMRYELWDGELIEMSPAEGEHGWLSADYARLIGTFVVAHELGEVFDSSTGFWLGENPDSVVAPDIAFVRENRLPPDGTWKGFFRFAPDLAVEVVSPSERGPGIAAKIARYLAAGTALVVVVTARHRRLTLHRADQPPLELNIEDDFTCDDLIPGLRIPVAAIFRRVPPAG